MNDDDDGDDYLNDLHLAPILSPRLTWLYLVEASLVLVSYPNLIIKPMQITC